MQVLMPFGLFSSDPAVLPFTDDQVKILGHCEVDNVSGNSEDFNGHRIDGQGGASLTPAPKFGSFAYSLNSGNDSIQVLDAPLSDFNVGGDEWTLEYWIFWQTPGPTRDLIHFGGVWGGSNSERSWQLYWDKDAQKHNFQYRSGSTTTTLTQADTFNWQTHANTYVHFCVERANFGASDEQIRVYANFDLVASFDVTGITFNNPSHQFSVGNNSVTNDGVNGRIDEIRFINGVGIYRKDTIPAITEEFPDPVM